MESVKVNSERWFILASLDDEIWRQVRDTNYSVSNYGRIRRDAHATDMFIKGKYVRTLTYKSRIVKLTKTRQGYWHTRISHKGDLIDIRVHRLVAEAFLPNPNNLPFINHKDENPANNTVFLNPDGSIDEERTNLEWCTAKYNANYGTARERMKTSNRRNNIDRWHTIRQYTKDGILVSSFECKCELEKAGYKYNAIAKCCKKITPTAYGYVWRYDNDPFSLEYKKKCSVQDCLGRFTPVPVVQYDLKGNYIKEYSSKGEAANAMNGNTTMIGECCRYRIPTAYGFIWREKDDPAPEPYKNKNEREIIQYTKDMVFVARYRTMKAAAETFTGDTNKWTSIWECCMGRSKTYKGFIWKYAKE